MSIEVKNSEIHGRGVFARKPIRRGERIGHYLSRRTNRDGTYVLWVEDGDTWKLYDGYGKLRFLNHRSRPNSELRDRDLYALRTIKPGEEVTIHYGEEWEDVP